MKYSQSLSVVVPIYNDEEVINELLRRLTAVMETIASDYEIILVDDGSRDRSWTVMNESKQHYSHLRIARLSRNFGQQNAIAAGLSLTTKDLIVLMDSDLQDRPEDIPVLVDALLADKAAITYAKCSLSLLRASSPFLCSLFGWLPISAPCYAREVWWRRWH